MSLSGDYDPNNIFAKIIRGEAPCFKVFENDETLAFMDVFPQSRGHTLVIPKRGTARNILDIEPGSLAALYATVQKITRCVVEELQPEGVQIIQSNGTAGGQTVFHIHVHIIPRWPDQPLGFHSQAKGDLTEIEAIAARLSARLTSSIT